MRVATWKQRSIGSEERISRRFGMDGSASSCRASTRPMPRCADELVWPDRVFFDGSFRAEHESFLSCWTDGRDERRSEGTFRRRRLPRPHLSREDRDLGRLVWSTNHEARRTNDLAAGRTSADAGNETAPFSRDYSVTTFQRPDPTGRYGRFGGKYVPETLIAALAELESTYAEVTSDPEFQRELDVVLKTYVGRETPLYFAEQLTKYYRKDGMGPDIYLKREDLNHTGAHKINNAVGQALLAKRIGKKRIIAETGAGQHGVATATVCARFGLDCVVYMGAQDMERQKLNVFRMRLLGAEVRPVHSGTATLKDATSEAIRDWVTNVETTHYILGSVAGPHPYPMMVRDFHACIGKETRKQCMESFGRKPDILMACVGGGSNAMGLFHDFVDDEDVRLIGVEAAGEGIGTTKHAATLTKGTPGVLHGSFSLLLQDMDGQITEPHSISAGLDYPGIGPEHAFLMDIGRAEYFAVTDQEALNAFQLVSRLEGIIPALETSHALAYLEHLCPTLPEGTKLVINCSGRGDKDVNTAAKYLMGEELM